MKKVLLLISMVCVVFSAVKAQKNLKRASVRADSPMTVPGKIVVKFKSGSERSRTSAAAVISSLNTPIIDQEPIFKQFTNARTVSKSGIDFSAYHLLTLDNSANLSDIIDELNANPSVEYAEPMYLMRSTYTPNDDELDQQTFLPVISALDAWDITQGSGDIVVAVIDAGVDYEHEDLSNKIYLNEDEVPDNGIDDDNDGFVDNYYGWDFAGEDYEVVIQDNDPIAQASNIDHGTAVAGCAAADTDNGKGVAGVGFNTKYMAIKCSADNDNRDNGGAFLLNTNLGVIYAADQGADIINMSYGGRGYSQFAQDAMTYAAIEKDVVLIAAAGNGGTDLIQYPAAYDHVIAVANTRDDDVKASSSSFGYWVDLSAPGSGIRTTDINDGYRNISGTSFSSPIVAGAAGLLRTVYPEYNQYQIGQLLIQSTDDILEINPDFDGLLGKGRLNVHRALTINTPAIRLVSSAILDSEGNFAEGGEKAFIEVNLINELSSSSANTKITISQITGPSVTYDMDTVIDIGAIDSGQVLSLDPLITFDIPEDVSFNENLIFNLRIEDSETGYLDNVLIETVVNPITTISLPTPYLLADGGSFEDNNGGFVSGQIAGGINLWEWGEPTNTLTETNSGTKVWKTDLDNNLVKETYSCVLQTPVFDFSDDTKEYQLSFYKSMESEFCNAPSAVQLQYSLDKINWIRLGSKEDVEGTNWYNKDTNSACLIDASILPDQEGWLGNFVNEYTAYNVSFLAGNPEVEFRFLLSVSGNFDSEIVDDGFVIDDFQIEKLNPSAKFFTDKTVSFTDSPVKFNFLSNGATSYSWNFGDGTTSTDRDPVHIYTEPGLYDVALTITTEEGSVDSVLEDYVTVLPKLDLPFSESDGGNFEVNLEYFAVQNISGTPFELGSSSIAGKSGTASGANAWVTGLDDEEYLDDSEAYLYTPEFNFFYLGEYMLSFKANYSFENEWDGFIVEYTTDRGASWTKLNDNVEEGWYDVISDPNAVFGEEVPIFSGTTDGEFVTKSTDVSFLEGESSVAFRFVFLTDAATVDVGMALDDFSLSAPDQGPVEVSFTSELVTGDEGCSGQGYAFTSTSTGSITEIVWNFGANASPETASGRGPHVVTFSEGTSEVSLEVTDDIEQTLSESFTIETAALHTPTAEAINNQDGSFTLTASEGDAYQWYLESELLAGATERSFTTLVNGAYSVDVTLSGCTQTSGVEAVLVAGLKDLSEQLNAYPNPVVDEYLELKGASKFNSFRWYVTDLSGKIVLNETRQQIDPSTNQMIDLKSLLSGSYIFRAIFDDEYVFTQKLLKQ